MGQFNDKVALVTGAAGNLGQALCAALVSEGARIAMLDISSEGLVKARSALPDGAEIELFPTDLLASKDVERTISAVKGRFGRIDILANVAGGFAMGPPLHETDDATWDRMLDLNLRSVFHCCRAVVPVMLEQGQGSIVNVSARAALAAKGHMGPYCAAKAGVVALTEALAQEHKQGGIRVNAILPGTVDTPENRAAMPDQDHSRWVPPAALADVMVFLASDAARCVTGAAVPVYGRS
ncbi:3-oxoacyl-ACP reductase [Lamprobacter modestohalophilus]|uniref:3-oxoacyl-ACP reductase n=1 Tax=Lamprobacter modestohalophilus TaxID=1064514 RepID=A0A9X0W8F5_9GAMM|nr:SDR family NAD(P)-dependent oxidoreductase [Lamprobacter modestohalophilus]MBK1618972.1 3-oxoacyl-ACP reductase [Lamprobacter modestohalophilus]